RQHEEAARELVLEAGLESVESRMPVVLAAGIAVDVGVLRKRTQRLLELQVGGIAFVGQFESCRDDRWIVQRRADGSAEEGSVGAPISGVELVLRLLPRKQLDPSHAVIAEAGYRGFRYGALDSEIPVREVGGAARLREVEEGALLQQVSAQDSRVGDGWADGRYLRRESSETVLHQIGDPV